MAIARASTYDGFGELSDVSIKRKIRNRLMEVNKDWIFVQSDDNRNDDYRSLRQRAEGVLKNVDMKNDKKYREAACKQWFDVRAFGQVFAYKGGKSKGKDDDAEGGDDKGVSIGIRGPVSIHPAFSVATVQDRISSTQITKSVSGEGDGYKAWLGHNGYEAPRGSWRVCFLWKHESATRHKNGFLR